MSRLATVHRGAIRALQVFISQLSERGEQQIPSLYKELGHLIRQLSLCTAKLETGSDPAASNLIIAILQQVEVSARVHCSDLYRTLLIKVSVLRKLEYSSKAV